MVVRIRKAESGFVTGKQAFVFRGKQRFPVTHNKQTYDTVTQKARQRNFVNIYMYTWKEEVLL